MSEKLKLCVDCFHATRDEGQMWVCMAVQPNISLVDGKQTYLSCYVVRPGEQCGQAGKLWRAREKGPF